MIKVTNMINWTDTHCHIHDDKMAHDTHESLARAREAGVHRFVVIGTDAETCTQAIDVARHHDDVWATVGLHPHDAINGVESITGFLDDETLASGKVVAIGECGLDYWYEHSPRDVQMPAFAEQIALAHQHDLTLVIHTRDAWDDTYAVLDAEGTPPQTIIHCFSGGPNEARACLDRGAYLSFSGIVTFKNADELREAATICPLDRILVETDAPFLAPVPHRGRPNEPAHVGVVGAAIAAMRGIDVEEFSHITTANALRAFPRIR